MGEAVLVSIFLRFVGDAFTDWMALFWRNEVFLAGVDKAFLWRSSKAACPGLDASLTSAWVRGFFPYVTCLTLLGVPSSVLRPGWKAD